MEKEIQFREFLDAQEQKRLASAGGDPVVQDRLRRLEMMIYRSNSNSPRNINRSRSASAISTNIPLVAQIEIEDDGQTTIIDSNSPLETED